MLEGQICLDLFQPREFDYEGEHRQWLREIRGLDDDGMAMFDRLIEHYGLWSAMDYSKALDVVYGRRKVDGFTVEDLGLFTAAPYHVCWDRAWAARQGYAPEQVRDMIEWDYGKREPIYAIPDGHKVL